MPAVTFVTDDPSARGIQQDTLAPPRSVRDETQIKIDKELLKLKEHWAAKGKPKAVKPDGTPNPDAPTGRYLVAKKDRTALKGMIRRAGSLHKMDVVFYRDVKTEQGNISVRYALAERPPKK